jgi:hypothetical protein
LISRRADVLRHEYISAARTPALSGPAARTPFASEKDRRIFPKEVLMRIVWRLVIGAASLAVMVLTLPAAAHADAFTKETVITFSQPVELPGVMLAAGTYRFQLADPENESSVVQVLNEKGNVSYGMFITVPEHRATAADEGEVTLAERPSGSPEAVESWTYPGDDIQWTFVYPRR